MKKQFESEIERVAPFRTELQAEILRKSNEKPKLKFSPMFTAVFSAVAVLIVAIVVGTGVFDKGPDSTSLPPIDENKEENLPFTNIPILLKYNLGGKGWEANYEVHEFLTYLWNDLAWDRDATITYDYDYNYKIGMLAQKQNDSPAVELWFYLWFDGDGFLISGDLGVTELRGNNAQQLGAILGMDTENWSGQAKDYAIRSNLNMVYYSLFDKQRVTTNKKITQWQQLLQNVEWLPNVEVKREEAISSWLTVAVIQDDKRIMRKQVDLYINEEKQTIELGGDLGNGKVKPQYYEQWISAINEEAEAAFHIRTARDDAEAKLFKQMLDQMETDNYHFVNGSTLYATHALNIDGKIYYFEYGEEDGMLLIKQTKLNFAYFNRSAFMIKDQLNEISVNDMEALLEELTWESASIFKTSESVHEFTWGTDAYKVILADGESMYQLVKNSRHVAALTKDQLNNLKLYLQELGM